MPLKYEGRCPNCLDSGIARGCDNATDIVIHVFCDCYKGKEILASVQEHRTKCPLCGDKGEIEIGGRSPERIQCPHVNPDTYTLLPPTLLPSTQLPDEPISSPDGPISYPYGYNP